ncbi:MAG: hypothetical protein ACP5I0_05285 [Dictyoglomus sp.]|uniref:hypothetical protein n=1 Tax=Dictyoglomus sp. TaxID=28205 RepID=UPI003CAAC2CF
MKRYSKIFLSAFLTLVLLFSLNFAQTSPKIYINRINSPDGGLIEPARAKLIDILMSKGYVVTGNKDEANYMLDLIIVSANSRRSFNWVFLILPIWPIVPITTVQGEAVVAVIVFDQLGNEVLFDQTGVVKNGMWFFGDFVSGSSVIKGAVIDCINILTFRMNLR